MVVDNPPIPNLAAGEPADNFNYSGGLATVHDGARKGGGGHYELPRAIMNRQRLRGISSGDLDQHLETAAHLRSSFNKRGKRPTCHLRSTITIPQVEIVARPRSQLPWRDHQGHVANEQLFPIQLAQNTR